MEIDSDESAPCTVYIWKSSKDNIVGHVAISVEGLYISLWPGDKKVPKKEKTINQNVERKQLEKPEPKGFKTGTYEAYYEEDYDDDKINEGCDATETIDFYTLNNVKMAIAIVDLKHSNKNWNCIPVDNSESCASFVYKILQIGGIDELLKGVKNKLKFSSEASAESAEGSQVISEAGSRNCDESWNGVTKLVEAAVAPIIISPDMLARELKIAKSNEEKIRKKQEKDSNCCFFKDKILIHSFTFLVFVMIAILLCNFVAKKCY